MVSSAFTDVPSFHVRTDACMLGVRAVKQPCQSMTAMFLNSQMSNNTHNTTIILPKKSEKTAMVIQPADSNYFWPRWQFVVRTNACMLGLRAVKRQCHFMTAIFLKLNMSNNSHMSMITLPKKSENTAEVIADILLSRLSKSDLCGLTQDVDQRVIGCSNDVAGCPSFSNY